MRRIATPGIAIFFFFVVFVSFADAGELFYVDSGFDWRGRTQITATPKKESQHARWYFEDEYWDSLSQEKQNDAMRAVDQLANEFDAVIYPKLTATLGDIWSPGIDNDPKITIMFARLVDQAGGYFNTNDEYSKSETSQSNEREMFYINARFVASPLAKSFIAHEFQHLITFYQKNKLRGVEEETWLNEVRSEVAPTILGYDDPYRESNLERRVSVFLDQPSDSLIEWRNQGADYAGVSLFGQYLLDHYGEQLFRETLMTAAVGIGSINDALQTLGYTTTFSEIYTNWTIANLVNNCGVVPVNAYCYLNPDLNHGNLHITFREVYSAGNQITQVEALKDWEAEWQEFTPGAGISKNVLKLGFVSFVKDPVFRIPYIVTDKTGKNEVAFLDLKRKEQGGVAGEAYINGFGKDVARVVVIPSNQTHVVSASVGDLPYTLTAELVEDVPLVVIPSYPDGSLLREKGREKVYVIQRRYKRWIPSAEVFEMYGHLRWEDIIEVTKEELGYYTESSLVRALGDERVWEIESGGVKHWLNISGPEFFVSGRSWESVFIINEKERNWYYPGVDITK